MAPLVQSRGMARFLRATIVMVVTAALAGACGPFSEAGPTITLRPRPSATVPPPTATVPPTQPATAEPGPTPTPFQHVVRSGETLLGIAALYGVSLDSLLALNPGVSPQLLSIGQQLLIPGPEGEPLIGLVPSPTAIPLGLDPPVCFRRPTAGVWCLASVHNSSVTALENLLVEFRLEDEDGDPVERSTVLAPLNLLPAGGTMPLLAAFADATGEEAVSALVLSVLPATGLESRYRRPVVQRSGDDRQDNGLSWRVDGELALPEDAPASNRTLLLATAFDDRDRVVGFAVWEPESPVAPGESVPFSVRVFSLGPPIARLELISESFALAEAVE